MSREEEIKRGAKYNANGTIDDILAEMYFIRGAEWADQHPREGLWDGNKVLAWISQNIESYCKLNAKNFNNLLFDLGKAMEE